MFVSNGQIVTKTPLMIGPNGSSYFSSVMPPMSSALVPWSAYSGIYRSQLWVYVVVNKLARATARLPFVTYEREADGRPRRNDHPMARLLAAPNPGMSSVDLWLWTSSTWDIYGIAHWYKQRRNGEVVGLYPLHPTSMHKKDGRWTFDNGTLRLDNIVESDVVTFGSYNPDSLTDGLSPLEPLRSTLENEWHARTANASFWRRGARPGFVLGHPGRLTDVAAERLKKRFDDAHAGSENTGGTLVLEEGMKAEPLTLSTEEAQYIETRKLNREEVCAAYDIPPPVVHILDRATFSNIVEQMRSLYRDTMGPRLGIFEAVVETQLRAVDWPTDSIYVEFLMDEVLRGDFEARQEALAKADYMTIAEKRRLENLPFIDGTDRIFMNSATQPLDAIDAAAAALAAPAAGTPDAPAEDDATKARFAAETIQKVYLGVGPVITQAEARDLITRAGAHLSDIPEEQALAASVGDPPALPAADPAAPVEPVPTDVVRSLMGRLSWQKELGDVDVDVVTADLPELARAVLLEALSGATSVGDLKAAVKEAAR